jgi:hypothetical protein
MIRIVRAGMNMILIFVLAVLYASASVSPFKRCIRRTIADIMGVEGLRLGLRRFRNDETVLNTLGVVLKVDGIIFATDR